MSRPHIEVMNGVNLGMLGKRQPEHYGTLSLAQLEEKVAGFAADLDVSVNCFQTDHEGLFIERLHSLREMADGVVLNPGSWTHYSWAIHDALEIADIPAVELHISDLKNREEWRQHSVIADLCIARISGRGVDGYREALERLVEVLKTT